VVANWILCLTCRQSNTPPSRELRLAREAETTPNTVEFPNKPVESPTEDHPDSANVSSRSYAIGTKGSMTFLRKRVSREGPQFDGR